MGLLSKIMKLANDVAKEAEKALSEIASDEKKPENKPPETGAASPVSTGDAEVTVPGNSWGPTMPLEENQFNYPGPYTDYFEKILREDFPAYRAEKEMIPSGRGAVFTLYQGDEKALVLEVLNSSSVRNLLRKTCRMNGTPYVRLYHDHEGWWNTRAYVAERIRKAMAGES